MKNRNALVPRLARPYPQRQYLHPRHWRVRDRDNEMAEHGGLAGNLTDRFTPNNKGHVNVHHQQECNKKCNFYHLDISEFTIFLN